MLDSCRVNLWGTTIGYLYQDPQKPYASFEYDKKFLNSGIEVAPLMMPLSERVYEFPALSQDAFHGVPGMIADSLPDKFGNAVIRRWLAGRNVPEAEFTAIDRLCYTGTRGMGALEYFPANGPAVNDDQKVNISDMVHFASEILNNRAEVNLSWEENLTYSQLLKLGTSAGGARAKAVIAWNPKTGDVRSGQIDTGSDYQYWLIKFDGVNKNGDHGLQDSVQYTRIEYVYYKMAVDCGINMSECRLMEENGRYHFMTRRFDRDGDKKLHMSTLGAMAHIDYNVPAVCSYEQASKYMREIGLSKAEIEQFYRRMVFNVIAVNQDDHVKNVSFLMDKKGRWSLAPAYDITFSYDERNRWLSAHQMLVNNKKTDITEEDMLLAGKNMGLSGKGCRQTIDEVKSAVSRWEGLAKAEDIAKPTIEAIGSMLKAKF